MRIRFSLVTFFLPTLLIGLSPAADYRAGSLPKQETQLIYSNDSRDPWNRIFSLLFTRTVELRLTNDFPEGSPFEKPGRLPLMGEPDLTLSSRTFSRIESGDRAIDPLYASDLSAQGTHWFLVDPQYAQFDQALTQALKEPDKRPALQRALMQSDIWAAYDVLGAHTSGDAAADEKADKLLSRLAQFVTKLALTPEEIAHLPQNYLAAQRSLNLPELFDASRGWIEIEWNPHRDHDMGTAYRRAARIFLKPTPSARPFLDELNAQLDKTRGQGVDHSPQLDAVALIMEDMLVDTDGRVEPSPLVFDFQIRRFVKDSVGKSQKSEATQYELNRKLLLNQPSSGGLMRFGEEDPAYLSEAANDYGFARPIFELQPPRAVLSTLRHRCESCHSTSLTHMPTFPGSQDPNAPYSPLPVRQLDSAADPHGKYVAEQKMKRPGFIGMMQRCRSQ